MDVSEGFRLYCTTRLPNPHFTPELSAKVLVIDFTVTIAGLGDQLLGTLILKASQALLSTSYSVVRNVLHCKCARCTRCARCPAFCAYKSSNGEALMKAFQSLCHVLTFGLHTGLSPMPHY